ncbi:MAG: hypothetical protein U1A06_16245, partial [Hoeflea sp.]|nr:hypothetical protein [Hoeflea sp.]
TDSDPGGLTPVAFPAADNWPSRPADTPQAPNEALFADLKRAELDAGSSAAEAATRHLPAEMAIAVAEPPGLTALPFYIPPAHALRAPPVAPASRVITTPALRLHVVAELDELGSDVIGVEGRMGSGACCLRLADADA